MVKRKQLIVKRKLEQMSFESTAEGRVGVDGADRRRNTVPRVGTAADGWRRRSASDTIRQKRHRGVAKCLADERIARLNSIYGIEPAA